MFYMLNLTQRVYHTKLYMSSNFYHFLNNLLKIINFLKIVANLLCLCYNKRKSGHKEKIYE